LAGKMDSNKVSRVLEMIIKIFPKKDGFISVEELTEWVRNSLMTLDQEETKERFDEIDESKLKKDGGIGHQLFSPKLNPAKEPIWEINIPFLRPEFPLKNGIIEKFLGKN
jgi:hypothetical protein